MNDFRENTVNRYSVALLSEVVDDNAGRRNTSEHQVNASDSGSGNLAHNSNNNNLNTVFENETEAIEAMEETKKYFVPQKSIMIFRRLVLVLVSAGMLYNPARFMVIGIIFFVAYQIWEMAIRSHII